MSNITSEAFAGLRSRIKGQVVLPGDARYDEVRTIWNAMIDKRPAVIVQCKAAARRSGGHWLRAPARTRYHHPWRRPQHRGQFDLRRWSRDRSLDHAIGQVDANKKRAYVEPGATLGDLDAATQAHGLAVPVGINSTTGIAGLTLGGGFGWLTRKHGMTIDALRTADVVTADGKVLHASAERERRPVLGHPWRRRELRGRHAVRVRALSCWTRDHCRAHRVPGGAVEAGAHPLSRLHGVDAGRVQHVGGDAPGAAVAVPPGAGAWNRRRRAGDLLCRRCGPGRQAHRSAPRVRRPGGHPCRQDAARPVAAGLRPAAHAGRAQLLEDPQFHRAQGASCSMR